MGEKVRYMILGSMPGLYSARNPRPYSRLGAQYPGTSSCVLGRSSSRYGGGEGNESYGKRKSNMKGNRNEPGTRRSKRLNREVASVLYGVGGGLSYANMRGWHWLGVAAWDPLVEREPLPMRMRR